MNSNGGLASVPPFPPDYRASGLLLHVTSLPSPYGIGDLGSSAFSWVDRLHDAGQRWWQSLPLGPTGYGNSPYQSMSSFAGNAMLISPGCLILDGLLKATDCESNFPSDVVDYEAVIPFKNRLLETAWTNFKAGERKDLRPAYDEFCVSAGTLAGRLCAVPGAEGQVQRRLLPRLAGRVGSAQRRRSRQCTPRVGEPNRPGPLCAVSAVPPGRSTQGARAFQRRGPDRRSAFLCFPGLQRCLGEPGVVPARRTAAATLRCRRSARLLQRAGTVVGQSGLQLGCASRNRLSVVYRPAACSAGSRGCDSPGSLPRICGRVACSSGRTHGSVRTMGAGPGRRLL